MKFSTILCVLALTACSNGCTQQQAKNVENGVFSVEQVVCMSAALVDGSLTGEPSVVATEVQQLCPGLENLTQDVVTFITQFNTKLPTMRAQIKAKMPTDAGPDSGKP